VILVHAVGIEELGRVERAVAALVGAPHHDRHAPGCNDELVQIARAAHRARRVVGSVVAIAVVLLGDGNRRSRVSEAGLAPITRQRILGFVRTAYEPRRGGLRAAPEEVAQRVRRIRELDGAVVIPIGSVRAGGRRPSGEEHPEGEDRVRDVDGAVVVGVAPDEVTGPARGGEAMSPRTQGPWRRFPGYAGVAAGARLPPYRIADLAVVEVIIFPPFA
jgi:hypothetical protein